MNGNLMAQVTNLEFTNSYFEDYTNITETAWAKKRIVFTAYTADKAYRANFTINTDHVAGQYTQTDFPSYQFYLTNLSSYDQYHPTTATAVVTEEGNTVKLVADMTTNNGDFHVVVTCVKPEQVNVKVGGIAIYDYAKPRYSISGETSEFTINLNIGSSATDGSLVDGEYTLGDYDNLFNKAFSLNAYFVKGSKVTVQNTTSWNGDPCVNITGEVMGTNGQKYVLNLTSGIEEPDNMLQLNDEAAVVTPDFRENGRWTMEGKTQNILVSLQFSREDYAGTYDKKKYNFGYNNIVKVGGIELTLEDAHIVVTDLGETVNATGWILASNAGQQYYIQVDMTGVKGTEPAADGDSASDIDVAFRQWNITSDWMWGGWILNAQNEDGYRLHLVSTTMYESGNLPVGKYNVTSDWEEEFRLTPSINLEANNGGDDWEPLSTAAAAAEPSRVPNGCYVSDADGNFWFIYKGSAVVQYDNDGLNIVLDCVNTAGNKVKVSVGANAVPTAISTLFAPTTKAVKYVQNGKLLIEKDGKTYDASGAQK